MARAASPATSAARGALPPTGLHELADGAARCPGPRLDEHTPGHDDYSMSESQDFVEVTRMEEDCRAGRCRCPKPLVDGLGGADVEPASRIFGHDDARPRCQLPCDHDLLLITSAEARRWSIGSL